MMCARWSTFLLLGLLMAGCAGPAPRQRPEADWFQFDRDSFAFGNQLMWDYHIDESTGATTVQKREPKPSYTLRCFVMARSARQFFNHARFEDSLPKVDNRAYRLLVRRVMRRNPRTESPPDRAIVIPGHAGLRDFSAHHENLLKELCGGAWQSYVQRGHWRMIFPFSQAHQRRTLSRLVRSVASGRPAVVHLVRFPRLTINHAVLVYEARPMAAGTDLAAYDPNDPDTPMILHFEEEKGRFSLQPNHYFSGGRVDVYEVFTGILH